MVIHYIYKIHFLCGYPSGRYYIGKHTHKGKSLSSDKYTGSGNFCYSYFDKYGKIEGVTYIKEILEINPSAKINDDREIEVIGDLWKTDELCMNLIPGGNGVYTGEGVCKNVCQYDYDGNLIAEYDSQIEASEAVGVASSAGISKCCINKCGSVGGYIWRFKSDGFSEQYIKHKMVSQYTKDGLLVKRYDTIMDASKELNISPNSINACCKKRRNSAGGFVWRYWNDQVSKDDFSVKFHKIRPVSQYDINGNLIGEYISLGEAYKHTGVHWQNIQKALDTNKISGGFIWKEKGDPVTPNDIEVLKKKRKRKIVKRGPDGKVIYYSSLFEAAKDNNLKYQTIQYAIKHKRPVNDNIWEYGEYI